MKYSSSPLVVSLGEFNTTIENGKCSYLHVSMEPTQVALASSHSGENHTCVDPKVYECD